MCNHDHMDTANLEHVARRYRDAEAALDAARTDLQTEAVAFLQQHASERGSQAAAVRITGWSREHLRRLKEKAEMEALRRKVDELSAPEKSIPAVTAPRQQVTQALPKPVPSISTKVRRLPADRVSWLANKAEEMGLEWVAELRREYPHLKGPDWDYVVVETGLQKGLKIPELADAPAVDNPSERPVSGEETSG